MCQAQLHQNQKRLCVTRVSSWNPQKRLIKGINSINSIIITKCLILLFCFRMRLWRSTSSSRGRWSLSSSRTEPNTTTFSTKNLQPPSVEEGLICSLKLLKLWKLLVTCKNWFRDYYYLFLKKKPFEKIWIERLKFSV